MEADCNRVNLSEDIQETIGQICQKLESSGEDCLFLRVANRGTTFSNLGTKNALLFVQNQPKLTQEFRKFCAEIYSSPDVLLKKEGDSEEDASLRLKIPLKARIQTGPDREHDGLTDKMITRTQQTRSLTNKPCDGIANTRDRRKSKTAPVRDRTRSDRTNKGKNTTRDIKSKTTKRKAEINSKNGKSESCTAGKNSTAVDGGEVNVTVCTSDQEESNEVRTRPKRKMFTPSKLKLYETSFKKGSENSWGVDKEKSEKQNVAQNKCSLSVEESKHCNSQGKVNLTDNKKQLDTPSDVNLNCVSTFRKNRKKSKVDEKGSSYDEDSDVIDEDEIEEYDDNDKDYVAEKDESFSNKLPSSKNSSGNKKNRNTLKEKTRYTCKKCDVVFAYQGTLNRHLKNDVCSAIVTRQEAKKAKFLNQSEESLKRQLNDTICNKSVKKLKGPEASKPGAGDNSKDENSKLPEGMHSARFKRLAKCGVCGAYILQRGMNKHLSSKACKARAEKKRRVVKWSSGEKCSENSDLSPEQTSTKTGSDELSPLSSTAERKDDTTGENSTYEVGILNIKIEKEDTENNVSDINDCTSVITNNRHTKTGVPCSTCNFVFSSKETLKRHKTKGFCPGIKLEVKTSISDGQEKFTCEECDKTFLSSFAFLRHRHRHTTSRSSGFTCTVCETEFLYDWERVSHMVRFHKLKGPIDCFVCLHSFQNYKEYRTHKRYCMTTSKCEGETTSKKQETSGNKENVFEANNDNNSETHNSAQDNRVGVVDKGEINPTSVAVSNLESEQEIPPGNVRVKLSCGSIISVKDSMIKSSFVADNEKSANTDNNDAETLSRTTSPDKEDSQGEMQASSVKCETSQGDKSIVEGGVSATKSLTVDSVPVTSDVDATSIICTRCQKDVRGLFTKDAGKHICKFCRRSYVSDFQLTKHMSTHTASKFYSCHHCSKCFLETRYLQRHLLDTHRERYSICRFCCALFSTRKGLTQHLKEKHPNQGETRCRVCSQDFPDQISCMEHEDKHARERTRQYVCDICGKMLNSKHSLSLHLAWHKDLRPYVCEVCNKGFRTKMNLLGHAPVHSGVKAHQCEICGQCFTLKETLRRHKRIHNKDKRYQCKICGHKFRSTDGLNSHMVSSHLTAQDISSLKFKVRQCDLCNKLCSSKQTYERHMTTHTGERPFHCKYCPRSYSLNTLLLRHVRTVHQRADVHTCLLCHCQISSRSKWRRHLRTRKHKDRCEEQGLTDPGEDGMVEGIHYTVSGEKDINTGDVELDNNVEETQEIQNEDYIQNLPEEVDESGYIQQITEEVHDSGFIHQITGEVQNSEYIQQITEVVQDSNITHDENYIEQITQEVETVSRGQTTVMQIVYDDQSESQTAVNSIVEGRTLQNVVYLKVVS
ncbi:zinc finger protein 91-like [Ylistrum balloti]|uniref:zinc finger protein 91-like n=1 Tax=Ylistrum balloti TaxID=509963 RepID=UPI00290594E4|nr:zinc finger protein 91-like [Ylistrum balloti]